MQFESIEIENWGPFRGSHCVDLHSSEVSPVVLIYGENGKGKTSFAKALEWCLFGELVGGTFDASLYSNWSCIREDLSFLVSVKLVFTVAESGEVSGEEGEGSDSLGRLYELNRSYMAHPINGGRDLKVRVTEENTQLRIDGGNPELTAVINPLIRLFLPFDMAKFFLFDGEQFGRLKEELEKGASSQVKSNIQSVMGLPAIKFLQDFVESEYNKENKKVLKQQRNKELNQQLATREAIVLRIRREIATARDQQKDAIELEDKLVGELQKVVGAEQIAKSLRHLRGDLKTRKGELGFALEQVKRTISDSWWAPLSEMIVKSQERESAAAAKASVLKSQSVKLDLIRESLLLGTCAICLQVIRDTSEMEAHLKELDDTEDDALDRSAGRPSFIQLFYQPEVARNDLQHHLTDVARLSDEVRKIEGQIGEEEAHLEGSDEATITAKAAEMRAATTWKNELTTLIDSKSDDLVVHEKGVNDLRKKVVSEAGFGKEVELRFKVLNQINEVLADVERHFVSLVREEVSERASLHYVEMMDNPDIIGLSIGENFQIRARHRTLGEKPVSSYGQSLVYVYAFIGALIDVSGNDGSWLIDTVGARLDAERMASVWKWLSSRKRQVIALPHSGELEPSDAGIYLGSSIARQYRIVSVIGDNDANSEIVEVGAT